MTREQFWKSVDQVKGAEEPGAAMNKLLRKVTPQELVSYQEHFDTLAREAYRGDLWGAAYIIGGGCSDDGFIDFRYGLIARGKDVFESALRSEEHTSELQSRGDI